METRGAKNIKHRYDIEEICDDMMERLSSVHKEIRDELLDANKKRKDQLLGITESFKENVLNTNKKVELIEQKLVIVEEILKQQSLLQIEQREDNVGEQRQCQRTNKSNYSSRRQPSTSKDLSGRKIYERVHLTEVQLQALMKGSDCVKFIGKLLFSSFPDGYFLEKENSFANAVSSDHLNAFFEIVSNKYEVIKRRGHPYKPITLKDMYEVMRNKVDTYRSKNRH